VSPSEIQEQADKIEQTLTGKVRELFRFLIESYLSKTPLDDGLVIGRVWPGSRSAKPTNVTSAMHDLRKKLEEYYADAGKQDRILIRVPARKPGQGEWVVVTNGDP
jgi:two-component SAPR family response regulator